MKLPKVSQRISNIVHKSAAKARNISGRTLRAARKPRVDLGTVATVLQVTGQVGADVPFLQAIMETSAKALNHIEAVKTHQQECKELAALARAVVDMLYNALEGKSESDIDDAMRYDLAELELELSKIINTMVSLSKQSWFRRMLAKTKNEAALSEHRQRLTDTLTIFQVKQVIATRVSVAVMTRDQQGVTVVVLLQAAPLTRVFNSDDA